MCFFVVLYMALVTPVTPPAYLMVDYRFSAQDIRRKDPEIVDEQIASRIEGELRFYDGTTHLGLFGAPKWLRAAIEVEERIMTVDSPVFMY